MSKSKSPKEIKKELERLKAEYKEAAQAEFHDTCKVLFEKYPRLKSFGFTGYTPYFNDGDTCVYSAQTDYPMINGYDTNTCETDENGYEDIYAKSKKTTGWGTDEKVNSLYDKEAAEIVKAVEDLLGEYDDDFYMDLVGDHVKVVITAEGLETEEYEHD